MTSLLERFIPEAKEHLQSAAAGLLKLERDPSESDLVNEVFRSVHTLKGASGLFDIPGLTRLVHAAEDLLGAVRAEQVALDSDMVDLLLIALDHVGNWVDGLASHGKLPDDAEVISTDAARRLRAFLPGDDPAATLPAPEAVNTTPPVWLFALAESDRLEAFRISVSGGGAVQAVAFEPDDGCFYRGEDPVNLIRQIEGLVCLRLARRAGPEELEHVDPFRCALVLRCLAVQPRQEIEHLFRYVLDQVTIATVSPETLIKPEGAPGGGSDYDAFVLDARARLAKRDWPGLRQSAAGLLYSAQEGLWTTSALRWLDASLAAPLPNSDWITRLIDDIAHGREAAPLDTKAQPPAWRILMEQRRIIAMPGDVETLKRRLAGVEAAIVNLLASFGWSVRQGELTAAVAAAETGAYARLDALILALQARVEAAPSAPPAAAKAAPLTAGPASVETPAEQRQPARMLKVDQNKVDILMTLIAELVVSKNSLPFLAKRAEEFYLSREMGREIKEQYSVIDRLTQELQRAIMDVRMVPVSDVFGRFPRLIRDLSRKLQKQIELKVIGEETAADKTIVDALADPLIHLVRNSIDHGIELPDEREGVGKPPAATIQLRAFQEADQVVIEVSDDGRGIDPDVIRAKAVEKGLIAPDQAAALPDQEAIELIFLPGFSTAREISDLSGRGVGMDVVRSAVDKINGRVSLSSHKGEGTLVRLFLPLSMVVTRVMTVEVGGLQFGVPMDGIAETVRVQKRQIRRLKQSEAFVLRNTVVPIRRMHDLLDLEGDLREDDEEAVLVARVGAATVGLVVDRFREGIDVILKPLEGVLAGMRGFSGSALLGDGSVLLVVDLKELI